jgi:hypothetical protein
MMRVCSGFREARPASRRSLDRFDGPDCQIRHDSVGPSGPSIGSQRRETIAANVRRGEQEVPPRARGSRFLS